MSAGVNERRALVLGGTGAVGSAVLNALARAGVPTTFTYHRSAERARALAAELGQTPLAIDLADAVALRRALGALPEPPDIVIHCAAKSYGTISFDALDDEMWREVFAVNCQSAHIAAQVLSPHMAALKRGHFVFTGALDRTQSLPLPPCFAASQGALGAMTMALAKELGPSGVRVNLVALGLLEDGLSRDIGEELVKDFANFSALRRRGTAAEVAKLIVWLALENTYVSGKVLSVNGGI